MNVREHPGPRTESPRTRTARGISLSETADVDENRRWHRQPRVQRLLSTLSRPSKFAIVGILGILVNQVALYALTERAGIYYAVSAILASQVSTLNNFVLTELFVFRGHESRHAMIVRYLIFNLLNVATLGIRLPVLIVLTEVVGIHYLVSNVIAIGLTFGIRYLVSDYWIWAGRDRRDARSVEGWFHYDIQGLIRLKSRVSLPELASFNVLVPIEPDVIVDRKWLVGRPRFRTSTVLDGDRIRYREQLGPLSAAFDIDQSGPIRIEANWLLTWSHHVLYTNMVEPVLRFLFAARGNVLLHCAAIDADDGAIVLSAQTDTGKTSTVLRLLMSHQWGFIADDMAIVGPDGSILSFPKPMTLSSHTMSAVNEQRLPLADRVMLAIRSRVHSKSGRSAGHALGRLPVPIVTINAWVQLLVPPPKYHVQSLIDCDMTDRSTIDGVVLMERGAPLVVEPDIEATLDRLLENTDDAYTFPPFASIAPLLRIDGMAEAELRARERAILRRALDHAWRIRMRVVGHSWSSAIPTLVGDRRAA
ncbi:MAG: dolichol-phosphate mannosyltransferase, partial [Chloroflexota bacterium]|nr:dolichol-phosphate mannosyltransferase [Chloroflexota bacterium]